MPAVYDSCEVRFAFALASLSPSSVLPADEHGHTHAYTRIRMHTLAHTHIHAEAITR